MSIRILVTVLVLIIALAVLFPRVAPWLHSVPVLAVLVVLLLVAVIAGWNPRE